MTEQEKNIISEAITDLDCNEFKACLISFRQSAEAYIAEHGEQDAWRVIREVPGAVGALSKLVTMVEKVEMEGEQ